MQDFLDYREILDNLYDGLYFVDTDRRITYWNKAAERITGYTADEVFSSYCYENLLNHVDDTGENLCKTGCPLASTIKDGHLRETEVYLHHKQGARIPVLIRVAPVHNAEGVIIGAVELFSENSPRLAMRHKVDELQKLALIDPLTQTSNRRAVETQINTCVEELKRYGLGVGLFFIDIDDFKKINDAHGHTTGDAVLTMVAKTIMHNLRPFDILGRWGGEEFVGIIRNIDKRGLYEITERLRVLVEKSFIRAGQEIISVTVSIGATCMRHEDTLETVVNRADELMYRSKLSGKNRLTVDFSVAEY